MKKIIRDGQVAVLYSPGFGAGWSTWNPTFPECIFDPEIVRFVEQKYGDEFYAGGVEDLIIVYLPEGTEFVINEYDGSESVHLKEHMTWMVA